jgi:hypothetical protein
VKSLKLDVMKVEVFMTRETELIGQGRLLGKYRKQGPAAVYVSDTGPHVLFM